MESAEEEANKLKEYFHTCHAYPECRRDEFLKYLKTSRLMCELENALQSVKDKFLLNENQSPLDTLYHTLSLNPDPEITLTKDLDSLQLDNERLHEELEMELDEQSKLKKVLEQKDDEHERPSTFKESSFFNVNNNIETEKVSSSVIPKFSKSKTGKWTFSKASNMTTTISDNNVVNTP